MVRSFTSSFTSGVRAVVPLCIVWLLAACAAPDDSVRTDTRAATPRAGAQREVPASASVLLYAGISAWPAEVAALDRILEEHGVTHRQVSSAELDAMSLEQLASHSLLIVPGGDAPSITSSLSAETHGRLRDAVQLRGLGYIGFCAGAWLAVSPAPPPGQDTSYGVGVVAGPIQEQTTFFKAGLPHALARAGFPDGSTRELLWYGGPVTPELPGGVVARYPDGSPAITQIRSGRGFVIVSGLHPAINPWVLSDLGHASAEAVAPEFAWALLRAAINQKPLPAF